ncbi:MAG: WG repeat-containing protein [Planctomycetaceae bacterium]|jgi:hypothetical protein|nr:WG repeat-containing protein [Planctomycetaceae bacterium]
MFCQSCGNNLSANDMFCTRCGQKTVSQQNTNTIANTANVTTPFTNSPVPVVSGTTSEVKPAAVQNDIVVTIVDDGTSLKYDDACDFREGFARVKRNGKWGIIDKTGNEIVSVEYDEVCEFHEGFARVKRNGKWGFVGENGQGILDETVNKICEEDHEEEEG